MTIVVTDDTTPAELAETLSILNDNAKRIHRRGHTGTASPDYERAHARIDAVLAEYLALTGG